MPQSLTQTKMMVSPQTDSTGTTQWMPPPRGRGGGGVGQDGRQCCRMDGRGAGGRHQGVVSAATQQSTRGGAQLYFNNTYPVRRLGKDEENKEDVADGIAGADWLINALVTMAGGGGSSSSSSTSLNKIQSHQYVER